MARIGKMEKIKRAFTELLNEHGFVPVPCNDKAEGRCLYYIAEEPLICKYDCRGTCTLKESNTRGVDRIYISGLGPNDLILKPDQFGVRYYKDDTYNKACDYLIVTFQDKLLYAIFVDLKTDFEVRFPSSPGRAFEYVSKGNVEKAWQMAGAVVVFESIERLAHKIGLIDDYTYKRAFVVIGCVCNKVTVSNGLALPTNFIGPPSKIVNADNFIWYKQNSGTRIDIKQIIKDAF